MINRRTLVAAVGFSTVSVLSDVVAQQQRSWRIGFLALTLHESAVGVRRAKAAGAKPSELPVEQSTKLELLINLKTAKALSLEIPPIAAIAINLQVAMQGGSATGLPMEASTAEGIESAFARMRRQDVGAVVVAPDTLFVEQRQRIAELAIKYRLPSMFSFREHVQAGGLMSYGQHLGDSYRRAATYVDRIFKLQPLRYLHACSGCFRLERLPGGPCTHWKAAFG